VLFGCSIGFVDVLAEQDVLHIVTRGMCPPTAALLNSSFQKARSRIQLTRTTDVGSVASFKAEMAKREVSQFALQPRVLVRSVRD
jgi:hypothetical protein